MYKLKKKISMHKMVIITKKTWKKDGVEVIVHKNDIKWLNAKHIEELGHANLPVITRKYPSKYRK